jgi:pimeloyl-ACP methyl ester carboxylesterase
MYKLNWIFSRSVHSALLAIGMFAGSLGTAAAVLAQDFEDLQTPDSPLVLKAQGSFYVGGEKAHQTHAELGSFAPAGHITINQMYVRYMVPQDGQDKLPVVMVHGATLTGKSWETTPDGRMGWDEYFVRKGHPVYIPDQVSRGRSGFNPAVLNNVRVGTTPPGELPPVFLFSDENNWTNFRFGPKLGEPYPDAKFPLTAVDKLAKQSVPDLSRALPRPNPTSKALSELAIQLGRSVLMGHSQSGSFPLEAALINSTGINAMVLVEPGRCPSTYTDEQIATLAKLPILVVYGDHLGDTAKETPGYFWKPAFDGCKAFITRVDAAGGDARMLHTPDEGIDGNSHMIMQDMNSLQIADLILNWIDERVDNE